MSGYVIQMVQTIHDDYTPKMVRVAAVSILSLCLLGAQSAQKAPVPAGSSLQAALDEWRASIQSPGASLGIVAEDGTVTALVSGVSNRTGATPMKTADLLMAGSVGKTFFAALALRLIEQGRLDLNAPISRYLGTKPWFSRLPNAKDITVRMLMTHTSGLVRYEMHPKFTADLRAQPDKSWTPEEEIAYLLDATPPFAARMQLRSTVTRSPDPVITAETRSWASSRPTT